MLSEYLIETNFVNDGVGYSQNLSSTSAFFSCPFNV